MKPARYKIVKKFVGGILDGLTYTEIVSYRVKIGLEVNNPVGGSPYQILECTKIPDFSLL